MSIACSGSSNTESARMISGSVDVSIVGSDLSELEIWALENNERFRKGNITAGVNGEDHTFSIEGLKDQVEYKVVLYRSFGYNKLELLSSLVRASATTGILSKSARQKSQTKRQINILTTFITNKYLANRAAGGTDSVSSIMTTIFDGQVTDLDLINYDGGEITIVGTNTKTMIKDSYYQMAATQMTIATVASLSMDKSKLDTQAAVFNSFSKSMVDANNTTIVTSITDNSVVLTSLLANVSSDFSSRFETADKVVAKSIASTTSDLITTIANAPVTTYVISSYTTATVRSVVDNVDLPGAFLNGLVAATVNLNGVTEDTIKADTTSSINNFDSSIISDEQKNTANEVIVTGGSNENNDIAIIDVKSFSLANDTYGLKNGNDFILYSLAPIFKVTLKQPMTKNLTTAVKVVLSHGSSSKTLSSSNVTVSDDDDLNFYIITHNSGSLKVNSSFELKPGEKYTYSITEANETFSLRLDEGVSATGNIAVADVTFTAPFDGFDFPTTQINLNSVYTGLKPQNTLLNVNLTYPIQYTSSSSSTTDFGLLDYIQFDFSPVSSRAGDQTNINFFDVDTTTETGTASWLQGFDIILSANQIESGRINLTSNPALINVDSNFDGILDGNVLDLNWTIPDHIYIDKQQ
jgi:hypothetical protein